MQNYGSNKDEVGTGDIDDSTALKKCTDLLPELKIEQGKAKEWLEKFYGEQW
jgi:hypothetical protein